MAAPGVAFKSVGDVLLDSQAGIEIPKAHFPLPHVSSVGSSDSGLSTTADERVGYPTSSLKLEDHHIDDVRSLRVTVIGAGLSGILAGILLPAKVPKLRLTILEKNDDVGGTWLENVYPGVRCDIPAHVYQATFSPRTQWTQQFAEGHEILDYWREQSKKYDVYSKTKFQREVVDVSWDSSESVWRVKTTDVSTGEAFEEVSDFVLNATGRFNSWKLPEYPGIESFKGVLRHTSHWDPNFDPKGKKVAVIGNGASGIQVVPNLQRVAERVDHYARNKTWIAASWAGDVRTFEAQPYSKEQLKEFEDPVKYLEYRKALESKYWRRFPALFQGSRLNEGMRSTFIEIMKQRTAGKPELLDDIIPDFSPNCRRLTPGPGYLESLAEPNVNFIRNPIKRFTETGIETVDGTHREVDAVFCATGAHVDMVPLFPIRANGQDLRDLWKRDGLHGWPYTYLGFATPSFPNLLFVQGPHGTGPSGTVPHAVENQLTYYAKLLRKVSSQGIRTITPSKRAADDFVDYCDAFFPRTVFADNCSSWYNGGKAGNRIHGIWPGSASHLSFVQREPRWEDWEYEYLSRSGNRFAYFGNGHTKQELDLEHDIAGYLKLQVDLRDVHERWWDLP
ncbi:FAD dependent oxidoreductase [Myriangium duriaei CBS 260.36]|uniref:FAD dependent oxidoreductase n=1 Tax=Myriangium duriaei CBS 260.36 TaxID=1168546 RepID=A0A9P4IS79_9PEZI|nr:FAD dependent oxidoreductase [Myriangium duriaei CBS 260.36]